MNDELTKKASLLLERLIDAANTGIDKAPSVIEDLAKEYTTYFVIEEFPATSLIVLILFGVVAHLSFKSYKKALAAPPPENRWDSHPKEPPMILFGVSLAAIFLFTVIVFHQFKVCTQAYFAPKAFLIEKIRNPHDH